MSEETTQNTTETTTTPVVKAPVTDFTPEQQDAINKIVGNRVNEAKSNSLTALAKELGYDTVDEMKAAAKEAKERKDSETPKLEKLQKDYDKVLADLQAEKQGRAEAEANRKQDKVYSTLRLMAKDAKAEKPNDVLVMLKLENAAAVEALIGEDGEVDEKAAKKLIDDFKKGRPTWFPVSGPGSPSNRDGKPPQPDNKVVLNKKLSF